MQKYQKTLREEAERWVGHEFDGEGWHEEEECYVCLLGKEVKSSCDCGKCCTLIVEVGLEDAKREPKIADKGSPIYQDERLTASGQRELIGYMLNTRADCACVFLEENRCSIYETRPLVCRLFSCDGEAREELVQLGILPPR